MKRVGALCFRGAAPDPFKKTGASSADCRVALLSPTTQNHAAVLRGAPGMPGLFFLAGGGLSSGGGLAGVGDLLAGKRSLGCGGRAHFPVCSGIVPGHFSDEGFEVVVAA